MMSTVSGPDFRQLGQEHTSFADCRLWEYLRQDNRPVFVLDLLVNSGTLQRDDNFLTFYNHALDADDTLLRAVKDAATTPRYQHTDITLQSWIWGEAQTSMEFGKVSWSAITMDSRWRVFTGTRKMPVFQSSRNESDATTSPQHSSNSRYEKSDKSILNGTNGGKRTAYLEVSSQQILCATQSQLTAHQQRMQSFDWTSTDLGPISSWPRALYEGVKHLLLNPIPGVIYWSSSRIMIYNDASIHLLRGFDPYALGQSAFKIFKDFWLQKYEPVCQEVEVTGRPVSDIKTPGPLVQREDGLRETFFTYDYLPMLDDDGNVCGIYDQCKDVTTEVLAEGRIQTLLEVNEAMDTATNLTSFWKALLAEIETNAADVPLAAVYSIGTEALIDRFSESDPELTMDMRPTSMGRNTVDLPDDWFLEGSIGFPEGHPCIPPKMGSSSTDGLITAFQKALATPRLQNSLLGIREGTLAQYLLDGCKDRGLGFQCTQLALCPLQRPSGGVIAWLVLGVNPRRTFDDEYRHFTKLLARHIESKLVLVLTLEKAERHALRSAEEAAYQQQRMLIQLEQHMRDAQESHLRFLQFAKHSPAGVYILDSRGEVKFCNDAWCKLFGIQSDTVTAKAWRTNVHPEDIEKVDRAWQRLSNGHIQGNFEWRVLRPGAASFENEDDIIHLESSCFPEMAEDGTMKSVTGLTIDVSIHKAYQRAQSEKLADALEAKRAQEYFMDMVSHEMRNPLNAIIQCAEETAQLVEQLNGSSSFAHGTMTVMRDITEMVNTILYCGVHQKQLINDVLTLSKLDSNLLVVSPADVQPADLLKQAIKIYNSEIRGSDIQLFTQFGKDDKSKQTSCLAKVDPSRVVQILINLISNAIKFMKGREKRELHLSVSISRERPRDAVINYIPSGRNYADPTLGQEWGSGEPVYLCFSVRDTGLGLTELEMKSLFARFHQASPRTHVTYGGSGLGLFISRELTELHGGEIGMTSQIGKGSTFAFYVKGRRQVSEPDPKSSNRFDAPDRSNDQEMSGDNHISPIKTRPPSATRTSSSTNLQDIHILLVEDNEVNQRVLKRQLLKHKCHVTTANHGGEALSILQASSWWRASQSRENAPIRDSSVSNPPISLILCDLEMPVMDGVTCVSHIREWEQQGLLRGHIPVIAVTGNARAERTLLDGNSGFDDVVSKPYSISNLVERISALTSRAEIVTSDLSAT